MSDVALIRRHAFAFVAAVPLACSVAHALRPNLRSDLQQIEKLGRYEEALFFRRSTMDMILAVHVAWSGAPYDPAMDGWIGETRTDRRYWNMVNGQKRAVTDLLEKAALSPEQLQKLEQRVRVYVEDHMSPEFDEMGNFYFRRKAMAMESMGLFFDASFRRHLTGYYCQRVCAPYYAAIAQELQQNGQLRPAAAYRSKSAAYEQRAMDEFRRANGDLALSAMRGGAMRQPLPRAKVVQLLKSAPAGASDEARFAQRPPRHPRPEPPLEQRRPRDGARATFRVFPRTRR